MCSAWLQTQGKADCAAPVCKTVNWKEQIGSLFYFPFSIFTKNIDFYQSRAERVRQQPSSKLKILKIKTLTKQRGLKGAWLLGKKTVFGF